VKKKKKMNIPMNAVKTENLHPTARKLIQRFITEMTNYGVKPTRDRLLAMACNPLMATHGMDEVDLMFAFINDHPLYKELVATVGLDHRKSAMEMLVQDIKSVCSNIIPSNDNSVNDGSGVVGNEDGEEAEEVDEFEELRKKRARESEGENPMIETMDPVESQVHSFFNQQFDPRSGNPHFGGSNKVGMVEEVGDHCETF
jgi:hypothetical protein